MIVDRVTPQDQRVDQALAELKQCILERFPEATFEVGTGEDPPGIYLTATVDVEDTDEVFDLIVDRLLDMQVEEGLPVYVVPVRPPERIAEMRRRRLERQPARVAAARRSMGSEEPPSPADSQA